MAQDDVPNPSESSQDRPITPASYTYPFASAPDIIRSQQKDAYFQGRLLEQLSGILRSFYGARFAHSHTISLHAFADVLYLGLTTLIGNRTLGEEYCDVVQVEGDTLKLPSVQRRAGYIVGSVLVPYLLTSRLPSLRQRLASRLELSLSNSSKPTALRRIRSYILINLSTFTSTAPVHAVTLALFYFSGSYYHLTKRLLSLRYIFTHTPPESSHRAGYEVLGLLLVLQIAVQGWLHLHQTYTSPASSSSQDTAGGPPIPANPASAAGGSAVLDGEVEVSLDSNAYTSNNALLLFESPTGASQHKPSASSIQGATHTPVLDRPRYHLQDEETLQWITGQQQRRCTLCLEPMRDPSVTTCGHVFCWSCIGDWVREKPECPLCRQECFMQHILPLRG